MDAVIDTDILSTFIKIGKLDLLQKLFVKSTIFLTPRVYRELKTGEKLGIIRFSPRGKFSRIKLELAEKRGARETRARSKLSTADSECVAVSHHRRCLFVTNDHDGEKEADSLSIEHINLPGILRLFWKSNIMSKAELNKMIIEIEKKDNVVIRNREEIFR
jgi:predicted nucleic acid-binding protein